MKRKSGIISLILDFLFGKDPDIFDENGEIRHQLPKKTWEEWHNHTKTDPQYNWRNHSGTVGSNLK